MVDVHPYNPIGPRIGGQCVVFKMNYCIPKMIQRLFTTFTVFTLEKLTRKIKNYHIIAPT